MYLFIVLIVGLKAFTGLNHQELFKAENSTDNNDAKIETATNNAADDDSDSDSDYEYFKAQKKWELTHPKVEKKADDDDDDDDSDDDGDDDEQPSSSVNTFADALKSAIGEDELVLPATVNQSFIIVPMKLRLVTLCGLIVEHCVNNKKGGKMIIFMATLEMVDYHSDLIETVLTGKEVKVKKKGQEKGKNSKSGKRKGDDENDDDVSKKKDSFRAS